MGLSFFHALRTADFRKVVDSLEEGTGALTQRTLRGQDPTEQLKNVSEACLKEAFSRPNNKQGKKVLWERFNAFKSHLKVVMKELNNADKEQLRDVQAANHALQAERPKDTGQIPSLVARHFTPRSPPYYGDQAEQTWDRYISKQRMQIGNISRTKGLPLKVCMETLSSAQSSPFYKNVSVLTIKWKDNAILHGPDTLVYIDYDDAEAIATVVVAPDLFDMIERNWGKAWDTVNYDVKKEEETAERQDKGRGKGKATTWTKEQALHSGRLPMGATAGKEEDSSHDPQCT
eukprot:symbB.v1.2.009848.t1/scaffold628.1/size179110/11